MKVERLKLFLKIIIGAIIMLMVITGTLFVMQPDATQTICLAVQVVCLLVNLKSLSNASI